MIIRVFRARIHPDKVDTFRTFLKEKALPLVRSQDGCLSVSAGVPMADSPDEFCVIMVWRDVAALQAFAGDDWQRPHVMPEEEGVVLDRSLHHYQNIDSVLI